MRHLNCNMSYLVALVIMVFASVSMAEQCFAPYGVWGSLCVANEVYAGDKTSVVQYHIRAVRRDLMIQWFALVVGQYAEKSTCAWRLHDLGIFNNGTFTLIWDNAKSLPTIQCYGLNGDADIQWMFERRLGKLTCMKQEAPTKKAKLNHIFKSVSE